MSSRPDRHARDPLRVSMLLYGEPEHDSRVRREAKTLVECGYAVTIATLATSPKQPFMLDGARIIPLVPSHQGVIPGDDSPFRTAAHADRIRRVLDRGAWAAGYALTFYSWAGRAARRLPPADVWHGHDLLGLFAAWRLRRKHGGALVYDSHELYLEAGSAARLPAPARAALGRMEGAAARSADGVITVNDSIATELGRRYGVSPVVIMNCPPLEPLPERAELRAALNLDGRRVVLYHGALNPGRGVEQLVDAVPLLPSDIAVVLLGDGSLFAPYRERSAAAPYRERLFVHAAVPIAELPRWVADADVGVIAFQPVDRNNVLGTPNKLFEYLEAGVPMVVSDFPEMRRLVTETGSGIAADTTTPERLAAAIRRLLDEPRDQLLARRAAARSAAESTFNWQAQATRLTEIYRGIEARSRARTD